MPDADFLTNTGHDFLIIFVVIGVILVVKGVDYVVTGYVKNNKVWNDPGHDIGIRS